LTLKSLSPSTLSNMEAILIRQHSGNCEHEACTFFDHNNSFCKIYEDRPIDCQLFPLDIVEKDGELWWAIYKDERCELSGLLTDEVLKNAERVIIPLLGDRLPEFPNQVTHPEFEQKLVPLRPIESPEV